MIDPILILFVLIVIFVLYRILFKQKSKNEKIDQKISLESILTNTINSPGPRLSKSNSKANYLLSRYIEGYKSKEQIGRKYERYIGYIWEWEKGYDVKFNGLLNQLKMNLET